MDAPIHLLFPIEALKPSGMSEDGRLSATVQMLGCSFHAEDVPVVEVDAMQTGIDAVSESRLTGLALEFDAPASRPSASAIANTSSSSLPLGAEMTSTPSFSPCSCGIAEEHIVARSYTLDGVRVELWSTGDITGRLGAYPPGMGSSRSPMGLEPGRLAWGDISLYEWRELAALLRRARQRVGPRAA